MPLSLIASFGPGRQHRLSRTTSSYGAVWLRRLCCFVAAFVLAWILADVATAQSSAGAASNLGTLGNAEAARERASRFLEGRTVAPASAGQPSLMPAEALRQARTLSTAGPSSLARPRPHASTGGSTANLSAAWQALGPMSVNSALYGQISGRITSVAIDPNDNTGNTVYLGTTGGGVWKSTNAAGASSSVSFAPLTDTLPVFSANEGATTIASMSIGAVAVQPSLTGIVLVGTGDPNDATDSYYGEGLLRSADAGQTWTLATGSKDGANGTHSFAGLATAGLAWSSATPTLVVAAMTFSTEGNVVQATNGASVPGLYYSPDAGVTWHMATVYDASQVVQAPAAAGVAQAEVLATAVVWDAQRAMFIAALASHGYYSSVDGQTWKRLANQPGTGLTTTNCPVGVNGIGSANCPIFRGTLAVQASTGDLYALTVDANGKDQGLWQDLCNAGANSSCATAAPVFAARLDNGALEVGGGQAGGSTAIVQGSYDLALAAAPAGSNGTVLFAGTVDLYRCALAAGSSICTWRNTTNAGNACNAPATVAPAQHALTAVAQASGQPLLFLGNDGGLWRSTDGVAETGAVCSATDASHFDNLNGAIAKGGSLAEIVGFAQDPQLTGTLLAGLGESGSAATTTAIASAASATGWAQFSSGEGGYPQLDPANSSNWYLAVGVGVDLQLCPAGSACSLADFLPPATVGEAQVAEDAALLDAPTLLDPQDTTNLLVATCRIWRGPAQTGAGWSTANALSPAMDGSATPCALTSAFIRSIGAGGPNITAASAAQSGSQVLYAGMAGVSDGGGSLGGHIFVTTSANTASARTAWTDTARGLVSNSSAVFNATGADISAVVADPHDATGATVYATVMGFGAMGGDAPHVYRSIDFGGHWTDITANLPNAPANTLVVDPNDANTIYVGLDTGVYVTQAVTTCATVNCWSVLGTGLPNAPVTQLEAGAQLSTGDGRLGMLRAGTYGRGLWQTPLLSAVSTLTPGLRASVSSLSFPTQQQGTESAAQTVTLTSTGNSPVMISTLVTTGDFVETDTCSGQTLAVGSTCTVSVSFAPAAIGNRTGQLTIYANIAGGQVTVALAGTASAPAAILLTPVNLAFPSTTVNQTAATQIITISNTGGNAATLQTPTITGDFTIKQSTCGAALPSQTGCSVVIAFTPTIGGTRTGVLTVVDSAGTQTAQLSGIGQSPATDTLSPLSLTFGNQQVGSTSASQQVTLTNAGDVPLLLIAASISSGDFTATNSCGSSLAAHSTCAITVKFVPTAPGGRTGVLSISDEVRLQTIPLNGTGVAPPGVSLAPLNVGFGAWGVGLNAPVQTVTLTNNGGLPLTIMSTAITGDFTIASTTCGSTLVVGSACNYTLLFSPSAAGPRTGVLTLVDNAPQSTQSVSLSGTGVDFSLVPNGATAVTVSSGSAATFPLQLTSAAGLSGTVALSCTGVPAHSVCTVSPAAAALGGTVQVSVVVQTGMATAMVDPRKPQQWMGRGGGFVLALVCPACFGLRRRHLLRVSRRSDGHLPMLLCMASLCLAGLISLSGCGAGRAIPLGGGASGTTAASTPTPSGTYNITVSGATAGVTHVVALSLTIQ